MHTLLNIRNPETTSEKSTMYADFHDTLLKGNIFKEIVKVLLEKSEYLVIPYGYENPFANIKKRLSQKSMRDSLTARRIRSSPDLLVYDEETEGIRLVEVKMSSFPSPRFKKERIETYKEFWNEAVLVMVLPFENVFYAQDIANLGIKKEYDPRTDFLKIQEMFNRISPEDLDYYGKVACNIIKAMISRPTEPQKPR
jgi:hypothetical protein